MGQLTRTVFGPYQSATEPHGTGTYTTPSFTPTPNSLMIVKISASSNLGTGDIENTLSISDSASRVYTSRLISTDALSWEYGGRFFSTIVGKNPASQTITVDCGAEDVYFYSVQVVCYQNYNRNNPFGVTGLATAGSSAAAFSFSLALEPRITSEVLAFFDGQSGGVGSTALPGVGWTELFDATTISDWHHYHLQARSGSTERLISWVDVSSGVAISDLTAGAIEIRGADEDTSKRKPVDFSAIAHAIDDEFFAELKTPAALFSLAMRVRTWFDEDYDFVDGGGPQTFFVLPSMTAVGTSSYARVVSYLRTFSNSAVGTPTRTRVASFFRSFQTTAVGTVALVTSFVYLRAFTMTAVGTAALTRGLILSRAFAFSAVGTVTRQLQIGVNRALSAVGTLTRQLRVNVSRGFSAVGSSVMQRLVSLFRTFSGIGTASLVTSLVTRLTLTFSAIGTLVTSATFIPGTPLFLTAAYQAIRRLFSRLRR